VNQYAEGGFIAPNGKESNLTPEQYKLVRTPEFKAWFGNWESYPEDASKVIDGNGEPMVVYHGTGTDFTVFKIGATGGMFFTDKKSSAEQFSEGYLKRQGLNPHIKECFLSMKKPFYKGVTRDEAMEKEYWDEYFNDRPFIKKSTQKSILSNKGGFSQEIVTFGIVNEDAKNKLIKYGYDGIVFEAKNKAMTYVVFRPEQIKLADGSNTTFDSNNPDIRYESGGVINEDAQQLIDIISMNPKSDKYQKYKDTLREKYNIDFDSIYKDEEYINNATLSDIKKQEDFFDLGNWLRYAKIISEKRGFIPMGLYDTPADLKNVITDDIWEQTANMLNFTVEKVLYTERGTGSGDIARAFGDKIYYTKEADLYYFLHEIGHVYDFQNKLTGIIKNPAYSPTRYGTTNGGETFAENFAIYFINPDALKDWNKEVYDAMDLAINDKYKKELNLLVNSDNLKYQSGGSLSKTPAPKKERIHGSDLNKEGTSSSGKAAGSIKFSPHTLVLIKSKIEEHNEKYPNKKITTNIAKAVVRRGMGAYSSTHRPTISGGKLNSRVAWGLARLNAFIYKAVNGKSKSGNYIQDDDLLDELGISHKKFEDGGTIEKAKKSNLNETQLELVKSKAFKKWFGDWENSPETSSKVIDENGEPLVVYHGFLHYNQKDIFHTFKRMPAFFSQRRQFAEDYASTKSMDMGMDADVGVHQCFLNLKKLFNPEDKKCIELAKEQLPEKVKVSHGTMWFLDADIEKDEIIDNMQCIETVYPDQLTEQVLAHNVGDILKLKVSASKYEDVILIYKDEDWAYTVDRDSFDEKVAFEIAEYILKDYDSPMPTIKYKGQYIKQLILDKESYSYKKNDSPLYLEYLDDVEKRKQYYIDNIKSFPRTKSGDYIEIRISNPMGHTRDIYVRVRNLKTYKAKTQNNWTIFENETVQKFLRDNKFDGWISYEKGDKTYAVYDANNIKLADGSNTKFSTKNADIRYDFGGKIQ